MANHTQNWDRGALLRYALFGVFFLSGLTGLIYESLWARYLGLFVGHTAYAQILVLVIFLGGMSLGALAVGARTERLSDPLKWYAWIELAVGALAMLFHSVFGVVTDFCYDSLFPALGSGALLSFAQWSLAGLMILPQSFLLGMTFPLMSAGILRRRGETPGRTLALLYFANSLGAAAGVLLAGFWMLGAFGLPGTLLVAGLLNFFVALVSTLIGFAEPVPADARPARPAPETHGVESERVASASLRRLLFGVAFGTAVASFIYEVAWIRMLSLVIGSASHSFELMLSAFVFGLALGAFWTRNRADRWQEPERVLGLVQWCMGAAALATLPLYAASFGWMHELLQTFAKTDAGYSWMALSRYAICLAIMLPSTFCAGVTLPLITRILLSRDDGERAIGRVYGLNTLGSIFGAALAGLVLLPLLGLHTMLAVGALLDMALGIALFAMLSKRALPWLRPVVATAAVMLVAVVVVDVDLRLLSIGVYRLGLPPTWENTDLISYEDGRTATVSVIRKPFGRLLIATNGKPDASLPKSWMEECPQGAPARRKLFSDTATQALSPLITLAHAPAARRGAVIGHGSGMSAHFLLGSPSFERVETIEIEPAMVRGSRAFYPANRRVFDDPRSSIVMADAKAHFSVSDQKFDVIFSEPSNPWVSGVSSLFTTEFYRRVRGYLSEDGVFGQWLHLYEIDDELVLNVLAALHENFPSYQLFLTSHLDLLVVAGTQPTLPAPDWSVFEHAGIRQDMCRSLPISPRMLEATRLADRRAFAPLLDHWGNANSDFWPVLELGAEKTRYLNKAAYGFLGLPGARFSVTDALAGRVSPPSAELVAPIEQVVRMEFLARRAQLENPGAADRLPRDLIDGGALQARQRRMAWQGILRMGVRPPSWGGWLDVMRAVEADAHGGVHGVANAAFYDEVESYLTAVEAPDAVRAAVAFQRGLAAWDFAAVIRAGEALRPGVLRGEGLVSPSVFLEGMVVALLRHADPAAAAGVFDEVTRAIPAEAEGLRPLMLSAYIERARRDPMAYRSPGESDSIQRLGVAWQAPDPAGAP